MTPELTAEIEAAIALRDAAKEVMSRHADQPLTLDEQNAIIRLQIKGTAHVDLIERLARTHKAASELERFLSAAVKAGMIRIEADNAGTEGLEERLNALRDAL